MKLRFYALARATLKEWQRDVLEALRDEAEFLGVFAESLPEADFCLDFSQGGDFGTQPDLRYGRWCFRFGTPSSYEPGWLEYCRGEAVLESFLLAHGLGAEPLVLYRSCLKFRASYSQTMKAVHHSCRDWGPRACRDLSLRGSPPEEAFEEVSDFRKLEPFAGARARARRALSKLCRELFFYDSWNVGLLRRPIEQLEDLSGPLDPSWLKPRGSFRYLADPFVLEHADGELTVLAEDYHNLQPGSGRIVGFRGTWNSEPWWQTKLSHESVHFSYPSLVRDGEKNYVVPECSGTGECRLYELSEEGELHFVKVLLEGFEVVDPTLLRHGGLWWLFCSTKTPLSHSRLLAFYSEELRGPYLAHPLNPLLEDVGGARPAGAFFRLGGKLFRPAQDCSETYGGAVVVKELLELGPTVFREREALRVEPDPASSYPDGLHHLCVGSDWVVLDAKCHRFDLFFKLRRWWFRSCERASE